MPDTTRRFRSRPAAAFDLMSDGSRGAGARAIGSGSGCSLAGPSVTPRPAPIGRRRPTGWGGLLLAAFALVVFSGAADPEVIRLRVPAQDVAKWFPPGTELRILSSAEFDARVAAARAGLAGRRAIRPPRLIRARHRARWSAGLLAGRTELVLAARGSAATEFVLEPWTPAILPSPQLAPTPTPAARDSGKASLWIDPSPRDQTLVLEWELEARPHSNGRGFRLGLPGDETTILELELPQGWIASSQRGVRLGPMPAPDPARRLWEIDAGSGLLDLELRDLGEPGKSEGAAARTSAWLRGATEIDLRRTADRAGDLANWTTEWQVELDPRHSGSLEAELDAGLELIDVQGAAVRGYRMERSGPSTRVLVTLDGTSSLGAGSTQAGAASARSLLRFLAHARVPWEGPWRIPAMRPRNATWTGGTTTVILDDSQVVRECREKAGRLVVPGREDGRPDHRLVFEAESPRSVAELVFLPPRVELSCTVRGRLAIGTGPARLDCRLDGKVHRGSTPELEIDLSPAWVPDQVQIPGLDDPVAWHASTRPSGATRLRVMLPTSVVTKGEWTLTLGASSTDPGGRGPLELPHVSAVGAAVGDEAWLAWVDEETMIRPARARGLAWIDPAEVSGLLGPAPGPRFREALAWRWTVATGDARVDRERIDRKPRSSVRTLARIGPGGRDLSIEGTLVVSSGAAPIEALPLWIAQPGDPLGAWHFRDDEGLELAVPPIEGAARARLAVPGAVTPRRLLVNLPAWSEKTIRFHAQLPWSSPGSIPLLRVPPELLPRGTILIETPAGMSSRAEPSGLGRLDPSGVEPPRIGREREDRPSRADRTASRNLIVHAFRYTAAGGRLELVTEPMVPAPAPGLVREAVLSSSVDPGGRSLNRLRLLVYREPAQSLELLLPAGSTLVRLRRDGSEVAPIQSGPRLWLPAAGPVPASKSSTIVVEYLSEGPLIADGGRLRPRVPAISLPCLSFVWEIALPPSWRAGEAGPGLIANDRDHLLDWPSGALGLWQPPWDLSPGRLTAGNAERLRRLDAELVRADPDHLTFAEWFSRWDSGPWPVVIDRLALISAGLGPRSPCVPARGPGEHRPLALATLRQHGLALAPFADVLLITTEAEAARFEEPGRWTEAMAETLAWGADRTDRFQTLVRWRDETSPRAGAPAVEESSDRIKARPGWSTWRFSGSGWPATDSFVSLIDVRRRILSSWLLAGLLALAWLAAGRRLVSGAGRWLIPAAGASVCVLLGGLPLLPARTAGLTAAGFTTAIAILIRELSRRARPAPSPSRPPTRSGSSLLGRASPGAGASAGAAIRAAVAVFLAALALAGTLASLRAAPPDAAAGAGPGASAGSDAFAPILALCPYEGAVDPERPPDRVVLRLADFHRLLLQAREAEAPRSTTVTAEATLHRVARRDAGTILVDSEMTLVARGPAPVAWEIPVALARDIEATLDGQSIPIAVEPGGSRAKIVIPGAGRHALRLRRSAAARTDEAGLETLGLPVNPMPTARVIVEPPRDGVPQGTLVARGRIEARTDGTLVGPLGPVDRIEIRWAPPGPRRVAQATGSTEGLLLWDVRPAGDRLRARLTFPQSPETSTVRLAHAPGLVLRSVEAPGRVEVLHEVDGAADRWLLSIDPPLSAGSTLTLDCWRPWDPDPPGRNAGLNDNDAREGSGRPGGGIRQLPWIQPVGVERFAGAVGVRRPGDWTGRLGPLRDTDPINDESFVKAWGSLPEELLTLCGTSRFVGEVRAALHTGPAPRPIQVRPALQLQIESGRLALTLDAQVIETAGHLPFLEAELPPAMQITQVSGEGLADWMVTPDHRMHLIWGRPSPVARRAIQITGWIPLSQDPLQAGGEPRRIRTPWIGWGGSESDAGSLAIFSSPEVRPEVRGASGLIPLPVGPIGAFAPSAGARLFYRVDDPHRLGEILWESNPPRVAVTVESQLTLHPDLAEWVSVLHYEVPGGPLEAVHLKMPAAWAAKAQLDLAREDYQLTSEIRGPSAFWSITPKRPLWGPQRFVLRSTLALTADREIAYPEIAPRGRGAVDAYLSLVNATGHPLTSEGSTGLQPIPHAGRFQAPEFARDAGTPAGAFRVIRPPWAWRIQWPRSSTEPGPAQDDLARVAFAELRLTLMPDRSVLGRAIYDVVAESGRLLTIELPGGSSLLWATVDANPTLPLRSAPGAWSIVREGHRPDRIGLIWKAPADSSPAAGPAGDGGWISLPRAGAGPARSLVTIAAPRGMTILGSSGSLEPTTMAQLELGRADWMARSIRDLLPTFDRSSGRDHERLVGLLINQELALRTAERTVRWSQAWRLRTAGDRAGADLRTIPLARTAVAEAVQAAGLADDLGSAREYLGGSSARPAAAPARPPVGIPEPNTLARIPSFGRPTGFQGISPGIDEPASRNTIRFAIRPMAASLALDPSFFRPVLITTLVLGAAALATGLGRRRGIRLAALTLAMGAAGYAGGPIMLAGGLSLAAMAGLRRPSG